MIGVIDTERIKGNLIYLFSYQLYNDDFSLAESKISFMVKSPFSELFFYQSTYVFALDRTDNIFGVFEVKHKNCNVVILAK